MQGDTGRFEQEPKMQLEGIRATPGGYSRYTASVISSTTTPLYTSVLYLTKGLQGDERALFSTEVSFSLADITEWLKLLNAACVYDLSEKQVALDHIACTPNSTEKVLSVWSRSHVEDLIGILYVYTGQRVYSMLL